MAPPCLTGCIFMSVFQSHWWLCGSYFFFFMIFGISNAKYLKEKLAKGFVQTCSADLQILELRWSSHFPQTFPHRAVEPGPSFSCYLLIYFFWSAVGAQTVRLQERSNWNEQWQCPLCWDSLSLPAPGIWAAHGTNFLLGIVNIILSLED